jgi:pimeloyl-ACP methyl ester carboxylesterase
VEESWPVLVVDAVDDPGAMAGWKGSRTASAGAAPITTTRVATSNAVISRITQGYYRAVPTADLGDIQLDYREYGDGSPVLGIMGFSLDQRFWAGQVPAVTPTHKFITFDNRGIGRSSMAIPSSIDEMANDTVRLLDHLEIDKAVVFGVSMGGTIAQRLVLDHPDRVSALILAVTWARPIEYMRRQSDLARFALRVDEEPNAFVEFAMLQMFTPKFFEAGREAIDQIIASMDAPGAPPPAVPDVLLGQLDAIDKHDTLPELGAVSCPTLVLSGKMDMMVPFFAGEEIAAAIPGAKFVAFETGHGCMVEEMGAFNAAVSDFLSSL